MCTPVVPVIPALRKLRQEAYSEFEVTQVNLDENMKFSVRGKNRKEKLNSLFGRRQVLRKERLNQVRGDRDWSLPKKELL